MAKLKFKADTPLYTADAHAWRVEQLPAALDAVHADGRPVVLFVHGRGKEPNKSLRGGGFVTGLAVPKIELGYDVRVLMFNWDSAFKGLALKDRDRPLRNTVAGAERLGVVLAGLQAWRADHPNLPAPVLLAHSMGSIVLQHAVAGGHWPSGGPLFRRVVFSQPDADDLGHAAWLETLAAREQVFVTFNRGDKVLKQSNDARPAGAQALGLGTTQPLAPSARYVDLSGLGGKGSDEDDDHEVFGKGAMDGQLYVCQFFEQALRGDDVVLETGVNVESVDRGVVYRLKSRIEPGAPCLKAPPLPARKG